jgi:hypothetical protein
MGRLPAFVCRIKPFYDRPDIEIPYLFYRVPNTNPGDLLTVFTDRFWDEREHWFTSGVGVVYGSTKPYFGPLPNGDVTPLVADPSWFANGLSYAQWVSGGYPDDQCTPIYQPGDYAYPRIRQEESFDVFTLDPNPRLFQSQMLTTGTGNQQTSQAQELLTFGFHVPAEQRQDARAQDSPFGGSQAQAIPSQGGLIGQSQRQDVSALGGLLGLTQVQAITAQDSPFGGSQVQSLGLPATFFVVSQVQDIRPFATSFGVDHVQDFEPLATTFGVYQVQDLQPFPPTDSADQVEDVQVT